MKPNNGWDGQMKFIGITGGVGAGKTEILSYMSKMQGVRVMLADEIARQLMEPGTECYEKLAEVFGNDGIFGKDGTIDKEALSAVLFSSGEKRQALNAIVHPAVKEYVKKEVYWERRAGRLTLLVLEAALLIEEHYDEICDELWYIFASEKVRKKRLLASRGYSEEKIQQIFNSQLSESEYRAHADAVIDNDGSIEDCYAQIENLFKQKGVGIQQMSEQKIYEEPLVFGLDIGTRNVVGTVGYKTEGEFIVVAQCVMEHETRAMLDGQIHDIGRVGNTIRKIKERLESQIGLELTEVCIAAAGRVLKTVTTNIAHMFPEETVVTGEDVHTLDLMGIEKAQEILKDYNDTRYKFYCVGYSVMRYFINDEPFSNLESHKADKISEDIIATFLPEDVVDGLYAAVGLAGLSVANLTLEPIAAINVAIPETYRMLNIALVDIGAGTSDICITKDGSIIAYGMIPLAGDELTELIVQNYLVDFKTAEHIKLSSGTEEEITYKDIMLIEHTIPASDVWDLIEPIVDRMTTDVAEKIKELNGGQTVSATFIVGGGGKIHGYTELLAKKLDLPQERVALRGEEVLQEVIFEQGDIRKDPLLVTPVGICLNYYDQKNNFIMVRFNGERVKMYNNSRLTIVDAALAADFPNEDLFPKRGKELQFVVNGVLRIVRGNPGESAVVFMNDRPANINTPLEPNSDIIIEPSTQGEDAQCTLEQLDEYGESTVVFVVNGRIIRCPRLLEVNGSLELSSYLIQEDDRIDTRGFYTVGQLAQFMDVEVDMDHEILVNNRVANLDTLIYENFTIEWVVLSYGAADVPPEPIPEEHLRKSEAIRQQANAQSQMNMRSMQREDMPATERHPVQQAPDRAEVSWKSTARYGQVSQSMSEIKPGGRRDFGQTWPGQELRSESAAKPVTEQTAETGRMTASGLASASENMPHTGQTAETGRMTASGLASASENMPHTGQTAETGNVPAAGEISYVENVSVTEKLLKSEQDSVQTELSQERNVTVKAPSLAPHHTPKQMSEIRNIPESDYSASEKEDNSQQKAPESETAENAVTLEQARKADTEQRTSRKQYTFRGLNEEETEQNGETQTAQQEEETTSSAQGQIKAASPQQIFGAPQSEKYTTRIQESAKEIFGSGSLGMTKELLVYVNDVPVTMTGKKKYIFVDIFNYYDFDLTASNGRQVITTVNGENAKYTEELNHGDQIVLAWKEA